MAEVVQSASETGETNPNDSSEGQHMQLLRDALSKTVEKCVAAAKFSWFVRNYESVYKKNREALEAIHRQYQQTLKDTLFHEIQLMFEEENMAGLLNELDQLIHDAQNDLIKPAWRSTGHPESDVTRHLVPIKMKHKQKLKDYLDNLEQENKQLESSIKQRKRLLMDTKQKIEEKKESLKQCLDSTSEATTQMEQFLTSASLSSQ